MNEYKISSKYEKDIHENLGNNRNLILLGIRADSDIRHCNKEIQQLQLICDELAEALQDLHDILYGQEMPTLPHRDKAKEALAKYKEFKQ